MLGLSGRRPRALDHCGLSPGAPHDRPGEFMLDSQVLQKLLSLYGPKVTTSSGSLGVSATRGEIWTPQSAAQGSAIWTPGSDREAAKSGEKRLILPG